MFFVGPRNKGNHHGFWVTAMPKTCDELVVFHVFDRGNWGKTRKMLTKSNRSMSVWGKIRGCGWYFWDDFTVLHPVFKCFEIFSTCYFKNERLRLWPFLFPFLSWHNLAAVVSTTLKLGHRLFTRQISCVLWDRQRLQVVVVWHMSKQWSKHSLVLIYVEGYIAQFAHIL